MPWTRTLRYASYKAKELGQNPTLRTEPPTLDAYTCLKWVALYIFIGTFHQ